MTVYKVIDFDVVFISYDEPNCEDNFSLLKKTIPSIKRVHKVKGFDAAHKAAGELSETHRLFTIDGDNVVDPEFFNQTLEIDDEVQKDYVFSWSGRNNVNGLRYGNGGMKCWPKHIIINMHSHENASNDTSKVDFCWDLKYFQMNDSYCETRINGSPFQAFRSGFREGVKMTLDRGDRIKPEEFNRRLAGINRKRLAIWCSVGMDSMHGDWCIFGARLGCIETMLNGFDINQIADYDWFDQFWNDIKLKYGKKEKRLSEIKKIGDALRAKCHFEIADLNAHQSIFFKSVYENPQRKGLMIPED